jgi:NADH:ubiquinone oxidoreductase subunit F (NADH-binding)/NADH:ubiquinone oxidoreductase subunit E
MSLRRYVETHRGRERLLCRLRDFVQQHQAPTPAQIATLARDNGIPDAAVRAALSYYADLHGQSGSLRVCRGTSCTLAGAAALQTELERESTCSAVYCLGYCDRSPVVLRGDDEVLVHCQPDLPPTIADGARPPRPSIRCMAQAPLITRRLLRGDCAAFDGARAAGVYATLEKALRGQPEEIISALERSGERGRGGAGYSTAAKWRACAAARGDVRYVIANGDEGDPGSFIDRVLMEEDPHAIIEGMILCGYAVGAREGIAFIRSEYPAAIASMQIAIGEARRAGLLGSSVLGSAFTFDISVFPGMGSYVCGEETALLNAIEGFRGEVRLRPPYPTTEGLYGKPTVVNNVETLVNVAVVLDLGAEAYARLGTESCSGTKALSLNHGFEHPGIVEIEFGIPLRAVIEAAGGGAGGRRIEAILLGGPMGSVVLPDHWDVPVCYTAMAERDIQLGHGGLVALLEGTDFRELLRHWAGFMRDESCGKCVPCRLGSQRAHELLHSDEPTRPDLERLLEVIEQGSLCAFGQLMPKPMRQLIDHFGDRIFGDRR